MRALSAQRCFNHPLREAAGRCLGCSRCYCRECVTEHEDRLLCAICLRHRTGTSVSRRSGLWAGLLRSLQVLLGIATVWAFFYLLGQSLLSVPSSFHDGTLWKSALLGE